MRRCYKCQEPYLELAPPGFQAACGGCQSWIHCCQNCRFFDEYAPRHCREPQAQADAPSDTRDGNRCEYFVWREAASRDRPDPEDPEAGRMRRKPDWRNLRGRDDRGGGFGGGGGGARRPAANGVGGGDKSRQARASLEKLFGGGEASSDEASRQARANLERLFSAPGGPGASPAPPAPPAPAAPPAPPA